MSAAVLPLPVRTAPALLWPRWADCPTASRYAPADAAEVVELPDHPMLGAVHLFNDPDYEGGAVLLESKDGRVMALEYADDAAVAAEWRSTLRSYAPGRRRGSPPLARMAAHMDRVTALLRAAGQTP